MKLFATSGAFGLWIVLGMVFLFVKIGLMWWLSIWLYDIGWWPIGAIIRVIVWLEILAIIGGFLLFVVGGIGALIKNFLRHKQA
jgi:hypothetical protein